MKYGALIKFTVQSFSCLILAENLTKYGKRYYVRERLVVMVKAAVDAQKFECCGMFVKKSALDLLKLIRRGHSCSVTYRCYTIHLLATAIRLLQVFFA